MSCAGLNFAHSPNVFLDKASAIAVISRLNLFFLGPGDRFCVKIYFPRNYSATKAHTRRKRLRCAKTQRRDKYKLNNEVFSLNVIFNAFKRL